MRLYYTVILSPLLELILGPEIIAADATHARIILKHLNRSNACLLFSEKLEILDKSKPVVWDDLIRPNEFQLN